MVSAVAKEKAPMRKIQYQGLLSSAGPLSNWWGEVCEQANPLKLSLA